MRIFLLSRILLVMGVLASILIITAEVYLRYVSKREQFANFNVSLEASAKAIRSDLDLGDLWSVRRNLRQVMNLGAIRSLQLKNDSSGEIVLSVPDDYDSHAASSNKSEGASEIVWQSQDSGPKWRLVGYPAPPAASPSYARARAIYLIALVTLLLAFAFLVWNLAARLVFDIETIDQTLAKINPNSEITDAEPGLSTLESRRAIARIQETSRLLVASIRKQKELAVQAALGEVSQQVAHDIRSPLAALDAVTGSVNKLPEDERLIIRGAVNRIKDIANHLLEKNREQGQGKALDDGINASPQAEPRAVVLLSSLIEPLITEKRLQFRSQAGIDISANLDASSYGLFAKVEPREFKRVLSNLINNSVEAFRGKGAATLSLAGENNQILLKVQDNGPGIPHEILAKLGQRGQTHGKAGGSGLGLYHARTSLEAWGGSLDIGSEVGLGTEVMIKLPKAPSPSWFISELVLGESPVVILDDDPTIHQVWQGRLDFLRVAEQGINVRHCSTPNELREWVRANPQASATAIYLMDFELLGFKETGLSLVEELNLGPQAILVTSRYEEERILKECLRLEVRLIPKNLVGFVPVAIVEGERGLEREKEGGQSQDAVLIDDDPLVRMTWKMAAKRAGKNLLAFVSVEEFFEKAGSVNHNAPIYIDSRLGNGVKGEEESQKIYKLGFKEIYLATGENPEKFAHLKHIRGVLGKESPWVELPAST
ncbi:MAG: HAMP domain-containing histidine kinase [Elusimicrobia bacterium]|nr:HAMP domain-containing histidine kinase [Elusimicrobiota bacterium]